MLKFADLVDEHVKELAPWEAKCMGQPVGVTESLYGMLSSCFRCETLIAFGDSWRANKTRLCWMD